MNELAFDSMSAEDTYIFAKDMGAQAVAGAVYCLSGDLGSGKTVFAKGFAAGLGVQEDIVSPTYMIAMEYDTGRIPLNHLDVYRTRDISEMYEMDIDEYFYGKGVTLVEWGERIAALLPEHTVYISIDRDMRHGEGYREIKVTYAIHTST